jgi:histidyl-tRNA synthetase
MSDKIIKPRILPGFRDFFAEEIKMREYVINTFKKVFEKYGYEPLETPVLEYTDIFSGEVGEEAEKLFFNFKDRGGRDVMLKYEVMISMCRAVAENINKIPFPYKRYQIQKVWRAEKPQKGRFREFTQCDADTIGSSSVICDAEFIQMGIEVLIELGFNKIRANISNRKFLNGILKFLGISDKDFIPICLSIDKLPKIGKNLVKKELLEKRKISLPAINKILNIITSTGNTNDLIAQFKILLKNIPIAQEGLEELEQIFEYFRAVKINEKYFQFAPYIARGLAYYTGPIWEFEIIDGGVGSVAGCGRYDNTIGRFIGRRIPATGGSFGIERIVEVIKQRQMIKLSSTPTQVLVTIFDKNTFAQSLTATNDLRKNNISTMLYPEQAKLDKQLKYADRKGIPYVIIIGPEEVKKNVVKLKNMRTGEQKEISPSEISKFLIPNF